MIAARRGEEQVGGLLDELAGCGWRVIHDATLGRGNVDHILIGPAGVFTVETKSHPGPVRVGRVHGAHAEPGARPAQGDRAGDGREVEPLIVFSRAWVDRPLARRKGVRVLPARMLLGYLTPTARDAVGSRTSRQLEETLERGAGRPSWRNVAAVCVAVA